MKENTNLKKADLILKDGLIALPNGIFAGSIIVNDGKISAITNSRDLPPAEEVCELKGKMVLPGMVDTHIHLRDPGSTERDDFYHGTMAAAAGGVTTVLEMPISTPAVWSGEIFQSRHDHLVEKSLVDFGLYGSAGIENLEEITKMAELGAVAYKTFLVEPSPERIKEFYGSCAFRSGEMLRMLLKVKETGLLATVHAEDSSVAAYFQEKMVEAGRMDGRAHSEGRPELVEEVSVATILAVNEYAQARLHFCHITSPRSLAMIQEAKRRGMPVSCETSPHYFLFNDDALAALGPFAKTNPPIRPEAVRASLYESVMAGQFDLICSDHSPYTYEEKARGIDNIWAATTGVAGLGMVLPLLLKEVNAGNMNMLLLIKLIAESPARIFGLFPRKGAIMLGADADLVVVDMEKRGVITEDMLYTKAKHCAQLYLGFHYHGWPVKTYLRGRLIMDEGKIVAEHGWGKFLSPMSKPEMQEEAVCAH